MAKRKTTQSPIEKRVQEWLTNLKKHGGKVVAVDFTQYYMEHFCDERGRPTALVEAIEEFRNMSPEEVAEYQDIEFEDAERFEKYYWAERAVHMIWLLQQEQIVYKPSVAYSELTDDLRLVQGGGRIISLYVKTKEVPVIYFDFPDVDYIEFDDAVELTTAKKLLQSVMVDSSTKFDDNISMDVLNNEIYRAPGATSINKYPNYACSGNLNAVSQITWQSKAVAYKELIDACEDTDSAVFKVMWGPILAPGVKW